MPDDSPNTLNPAPANQAGAQTSGQKSGARQRILLVTGMSGAGKTTALRVLEDIGWETVDNFPIRLLDGMIGANGDQHAPLAVGFDSRTRGFDPATIIAMVKELTASDDLLVTTCFLDCASSELVRRYNETRRPHPMAHPMELGRPILEGIQAERGLLEPLRRWAEVVIDTTDLAGNELQQAVRERFGSDENAAMTVTVSSFGFARGMPPLSDLVFDMRFLDNPHWVPELREQTGLDAPVAGHIAADPGFEPAFTRIRDLLLDLLPRYAAQGKSYVNIGFGCTGGRHRSVFTAERIAEALRAGGFSPTTLHRNLESRAADEIEGPQG